MWHGSLERSGVLASVRRPPLQHQPLAVQHPRRHPRSIHHPAYYYLHMLLWRSTSASSTSRWRCSKQHQHQPVAVQHQHQHQPLAVHRLCLSPWSINVMVTYLDAIALGHLNPIIRDNGLDGAFFLQCAQDTGPDTGGLAKTCKPLALDRCSGRKSGCICNSDKPY